MRIFLRTLGFLVGAAAALAFVGGYDDAFPWFWLPIAMGLAVSLVVWLQPWFRASGLALSFCFSLTVGTAVTYCVSIPPDTTHLGRQFPKIAIFCLAALFGVWLVLYLARGLLQRKTARMAAWLIFPILAGCFLGYVSGGIGGGDHMVKWAMDVLHWSREQADLVVHYLRKTIHFCAYGFLGFTYLRGALAGGASKARAILFALLAVLCMASFDELRQTTAPNRSGSQWDVCLDMCGAATFVLISAVMSKSGRTKKKQKAD